MSASFCDCVNQWEQEVGLQVLKDTKYLSLRTRGDADVHRLRNSRYVNMHHIFCYLASHCATSIESILSFSETTLCMYLN